MHIGQIVDRLRTSGEEVLEAELARVSPLSYAHIIPNGTYNFDGGIAGVDLTYSTLEAISKPHGTC